MSSTLFLQAGVGTKVLVTSFLVTSSVQPSVLLVINSGVAHGPLVMNDTPVTQEILGL